ncbi:MAG: exopolysaccharide biosynthesis polyprenyl glycosylphosphotransferase, partial [Rhodospirillales bacterium]|nr:exopolysaccharide biosynthesis polyprenyl glycosylphosphotransferase [Rhodospirillales bacterium]
LRQAFADYFPLGIGVQQYAGLLIGVCAIPALNLAKGAIPGFGLTGPERLRMLTLSTVYTFIGLGIWDYIVNNMLWSRGILIFGFIFALIIPFAFDQIARRLLLKAGLWGVPVAVIGTGAHASETTRRLLANPSLGLNPVCAFAPSDEGIGDSFIHGLPVVRSIEEISAFGPIQIGLVCFDRLDHGVDLFGLRQRFNIERVIYVPPLQEAPSLWVTPRDLGGYLGLEARNNLGYLHNRILKRALDLAITLPVFAFTLPLMMLSAAAVFLVSQGNPLYSQMRGGRNGSPIRVWKIRTMRLDAEEVLERLFETAPEAKAEWQNSVKLREDPRILPGVGRILRRYSIDELPQLWNVIRGDMSLVGPRPFPDYHLQRFSGEFRRMRQSVRPGLTGLLQVTARSDSTIETQQYFDQYYIRNWSVWLDLFIILKTFDAVLLARGAR